MMDLLGQHAAHHGPPVLERDRRVVGDRLQQPPLLVRERRVAVADQLADLPPLPPQREPDRVLAGTPLRPRDLAVFEDQRRARRGHGGHRRLHDRLEGLLEVEGLRYRLGDPRQRLQLRHAPLCLCVELRVHDRLRDLGRDRGEQLYLRFAELARPPRPDVERARELLAREDRHREDRLVLVLVEVRELLETRIEVRARRDHDRRPLRGGHARDPLARPHPGASRHLVDPAAVGRPEDELVGPLVVQVDEAGVRRERVGHLLRDELEHLLEVERGVDGRDRLRQQPQVAGRFLHPADCRRGRTWPGRVVGLTP